MTLDKRILIAAEDPGGANFLVPLCMRLSARKGVSVTAATSRAAAKIFRNAEIETVRGPAADIVRKAAPDLVILGTGENPDSIDKKILLLSKKLGVPSIYVIDYWTNIGKRLAGPDGNNLYYAPDFLAVIDGQQKAAYAEMGFPSEKIFICGHPHFPFVKRQFSEIRKESRGNVFKRLFPKLDPSRPLVLFCSETFGVKRLRKTSEFTLAGRGRSSDRTLIILEELLDARRRIAPGAQVVIRLHPKNKPSEFRKYLGEIDGLSSGGKSLEVCYAADLVAGLTSMILLEAVIIGKPVLSIVPRKMEEDWLVSNRYGASKCVWTREALDGALHKMLKTPGGLKKAAAAAKRFAPKGNPDEILERKILNIL